MHERLIFMEALDYDELCERSAYVLRACGGNQRLRARVEALLRRHQLDDLLALDPMTGADLAWIGDMVGSLEAAGASIGSYRLLEQIGEGGMGVVYLAEQSQPIQRQVAIKVIKPGMDSKQVIARFEAERQALALMDHPNIARIFDGGVADSGRPYFVMELVRGVPITAYCDAERLSIQERLELFVLVCRAVQHAHQKGIIHRDLKPSNILVTCIDGAAVPRVIDFGIAKATGTSLTDKTLNTGFHQFVGTPQYMSPEQTDVSGMDVDTRSDVYSLGVLLYELLTGTTPFDQTTLRQADLDDLRRMIREQDPPRPSTRLSSLGATLTTTSAKRSSDPRQLNRTVRGELDWIVMKALEKDRRRRYETASDFAADVMNYMSGRPVGACPPSAWYQFTKAARRYRTRLTAGLAVAMALIGGTVISAWQAVRATRSESESRRHAEEAQLLVDYLVEDVFGSAAPWKSRGRTITVLDLLASGEETIPARFGRQPLFEALARHALGEAHYALGRYGEAVRQFRRVAELRSRYLGLDHPETLQAEEMLVRALCPAAITSTRAAEAEPIARSVLGTRLHVLGPAHPRTLASMTSLAHVLTASWSEIINAESSGYPSRMVPDEVLRAKGVPATNEALGLLRSALAAQVRVLGPEHPETLETLDVLGVALHLRGDFAAAVDELMRESEGNRRVFGPAHPATLQGLKHLADSLRRLGRTDEANRLYLELAERHREIFGPYHVQTSDALGKLFLACRRVNDSATMREVCERWIREILASPIDSDPYHRSQRGVRLRDLVLNLSTLPGPEPFDDALAVRAAEEAVTLNERWNIWTGLGAIHTRAGRLKDALQALTSATQRPNWTGGSDLYWFILAVIHARSGDLALAADCYERGGAPDLDHEAWRESVDAFRAEAAALLGITANPRRPDLVD